MAAAAAAIAAVLVYLNALHNPFVYDDYRTILANGSIVSLRHWRVVVFHDLTRPIVNVSYAIDRALWGPAPFGFHLSSVLLHAFNVLLLFQLAWAMTIDAAGRAGPDARRWASRATVAAFPTAALFAVHPMMTEAVGYVSGRSEVLAATWFLAALLAATRWMRQGGAIWWLLAAILWAAGLLTKETAAAFPLIALAYDRLIMESSPAERRRRLWRFHAPFLGAAAAAAIVRLIVFVRVEHAADDAIRWFSVLEQLDVVRRYASLLVVPAGQSIFHDVPAITRALDPHAIAGVVTVLLLGAAAWAARRRMPAVSFGVVWFLLLLAPSAVLVVLNDGEGMAEHRVYLASIGLFLVAGTAAGWIAAALEAISPRVRWIAAGVLGAALLSLSGRTILRNATWSSAIMVWSEAAAKSPSSRLPETVLGESLHEAGRHDEAVIAYREAIRLDPAEQADYLKLALCLAELGRFDEAGAALDELRARDPQSTTLSTGRGIVALLANDPDSARVDLQRTLARDPADLMALQWLAMLEENFANDPAEALKSCLEIERLSPGEPSNAACIDRNRQRLLDEAARVH